MALMDLLASLLAPSQIQPDNVIPQDNSGTAQSMTGTTVSPLDVVAARKQPAAQGPQMLSPFMMGPLDKSSPSMPMNDPGMVQSIQPVGDQSSQPAGLNYNNSAAADAVNKAIQGEHPMGGSANPGIYGLLPQSMQHGTLRNMLGALGDAFLVGSGNKPTYRPRMEEQAIGQAMAGMNIDDPNSVAAAVQRVAATGSPGSAEMADKLQQQAEQAALRKQYMQYNQDYRNQMIGTRKDNILRLQGPQVAGMVNLAKTPQEYATRYAQAEAIAQRIGPDYHASDFGLVSPDQWQVGMTQGMTGNQEVQHGDRMSQQVTSRRNTDVNAASRIGAANISGGAHIAGANIGVAGNPTTALKELKARIDAGTASPADQQLWAHQTQLSGRNRRPPPGNAGAAGNITAIAHGPGGAKMGWNGRAWVPLGK